VRQRVVPDADLLQRIGALRSTFTAERTRTIAAVTRSASLREARRPAEENGEAA
jgi:hypothetical protein